MGEGPCSVRFPPCWYVEQDDQGRNHQAEVRTGKGEVALEAAAGIISQGITLLAILFSKYILFISTSVLWPRVFPLLGISSRGQVPSFPYFFLSHKVFLKG